MDFEFLNRIHPRLIDVLKRDLAFWESHQFKLHKERTQLHTIALITSGYGLLELDGKPWPLLPGYIFQISPGSRMNITTQQDDPLYYHSVSLSLGMIKWEGNLVEIEESITPFPFAKVLAFQEKPQFQDMFEQICMTWNEKNIGYEWESKLLLFNIIREIALAINSCSEEEKDKVSLITSAIAYMKEHYQGNVSRTILAERVSLSPSYFTTLFKKHTGYKPIQYINKIRIDNAKKILRNSTIPIEDIAKEVGFSDSFYFSRVFKKETGMSPSEFRKA